MFLLSKKKVEELVKRNVVKALEDEQIRRSVAMEYLVSLKKRDLTKFMEAVELRRQSDDKLSKLDEAEPDIDKITTDIGYLDTSKAS